MNSISTSHKDYRLVFTCDNLYYPSVSVVFDTVQFYEFVPYRYWKHNYQVLNVMGSEIISMSYPLTDSADHPKHCVSGSLIVCTITFESNGLESSVLVHKYTSGVPRSCLYITSRSSGQGQGHRAKNERNAVVTCEINSFQNYCSLRQRACEIIFSAHGNVPEIISKSFQRIIAARKYFQHAQCR